MLTDKPYITSEEMKTFFQQIQKQIQENQNELKAEIQQLKNTTTGELSCMYKDIIQLLIELCLRQ